MMVKRHGTSGHERPPGLLEPEVDQTRAAPFLGVLAGFAAVFVGGGLIAITAFAPIRERAVLWEAKEFVSRLRAAQAERLKAKGAYLNGVSGLEAAIGAPALQHFTLESLGPSASACPAGGQGYRVELRRAKAVSPRWGAYRVIYDSRAEAYAYPDCSNGTDSPAVISIFTRERPRARRRAPEGAVR